MCREISLVMVVWLCVCKFLKYHLLQEFVVYLFSHGLYGFVERQQNKLHMVDHHHV